MKKLSLVVVALMMAAGAFAQNMWVGGSLGLGYQKQKDRDANTTFFIAPEFGYKITDKISADLSISIGSQGKDRSTFGGQLQGLYWISLSDCISYTPGVFIDYNKVGGADGYLGFGLKLIKLECKLNDKMSLGFEAGSFSYQMPKNSSIMKIGINNGGSLSFRYWL